MHRHFAHVSAFAGVILSASVFGQSPVVTTESLLREMTDLAGMAEFPDPPYTCKQFSSYDRASKSPADAKGWFANGDQGQYLRIEDVQIGTAEKPAVRKEHVMMDVDGPGAIVRMWSADPKGTLRIYLDGDAKPAIECPLSDWLGGTYAGVPKPIAGEYSKGWNSYLPIPYAKHCKVTSDSGGFYYHVNYRTYPPGTSVQTFAAEQINKLSKQVSDIAATLASPAPASGDPPAFVTDTAAQGIEQALRKELGDSTTLRMGGGSIKPGETASIAETTATKPAAFTALRFKVTADDIPLALRSLILTIEFDGEQTVACPLGDFFGTAPGVSEYDSSPLTVTSDGDLISRWVMPFQKSARIRLQNTGTRPVECKFGFATTGRPWTDRSMHFHAKWRQQMQVPTRPMIDWNYLTASGQGVFAGVSFNIANPVKAWWGEGDEKIYVDDETFPSHFGTGTEDYYGYAWCWPGKFTHAYHNQPRCDGPGNFGFTTVNRFHILDRIPFTKSFKFDMELWHWNETCKVDMSITAYWYARPGGTDTFPPTKPEDLVLPVIPPYVAPRVAGAIEGEALKIVSKVGAVEPQGIDGCSGEEHLWWRQGMKPGDKLVVAFPVEKAGKHRVRVRCLMARDYGIDQLSVNDKKCGDPIDFYNNGVKVGDEIDLGVHDLTAGDNKLTVEITGANEKAVKSYMFGLDYVKLEPAP